MDERFIDERAMYEALPPHKQQEFDRAYQRAEELAAELRAARPRFEVLCDEMQEAIDRAEAAKNAGAPGSREAAKQYA